MTTEISQRQIQVNQLSITYLEAGVGPLVLCLHGFPDTPHGFTGLLRRLAESGYRAVAPYARGNLPTSAPADGDYGPLQQARDALGLIDALGAERAFLIGHDWGAVTAYAAANLDPARIAGMITVSIPHLRVLRTSPIWLAMVLFFQITPLAAFALRARSGALVDRIYHRSAPGWAFGPEETKAIKEVLSAPGGAEGALGVYRSFLRMNAQRGRNEARKILTRRTSVPTLCVAGNRDAAIPREGFKRMPEAFTGPFELAWLRGTGHFPHREQPDEFAALALRFLDGLKASATPTTSANLST